MKCTSQEFQKKVWSVYPMNWINDEYDSLNSHWKFSSDQAFIGNITLGQKELHADHVWFDGTVIKDTTGLFLAYSVGSGIYTLTGTSIVVSNPPISQMTFNMVSEPKLKDRCECECGNKHNPVGQGHSDWCDRYRKEF